MADGFVPPVKLLLRTLETGIRLGHDITASASEASTEKALQIAESVPLLQRSLERGSQAVRDAYWRNAQACGDSFVRELQEQSNKSRLDKLKNALRDSIDSVEEDPSTFDPATIRAVIGQVDVTCGEYIHIFDALRETLINQAQAHIQLEPHDDRASLPSSSTQRPHLVVRKPAPQTSSRPITPLISIQTSNGPVDLPSLPPEPPKPRQSAWAIDSPTYITTREPLTATASSRHRQDSRDLSPLSVPEVQPALISREMVNSRISANDEWLARRRESRLLFQNELSSSRASISSIDEHRVSANFSDGSPIVASVIGHNGPAVSPIDGRTSRASLNGYDEVLLRKRSQGGQSNGSRTNSILQDQQGPQFTRQESRNSNYQSHDTPLSPPPSEPRYSGNADQWRHHPHAIAPKFAPGIAEGIEVAMDDTAVNHYGSQFEDGLMVHVGGEEVNFEHPSTPSLSVTSVDCPMRSDSSFYRLKGFCEGAKSMMSGEVAFRVVKRPSGHYSATVSARCIKCAYEVGWNDVEKDRLLDRAGIYCNSNIRWRQKFLSKCHVRADSIEAAAYACVFCIDEHKTVEEHDATVFFSVGQLFRHLATHSRPLRHIPGLNVLYGVQVQNVLDFDLHFVNMEPIMHQYCMREISQKVATRPSAYATQTFHPKNGHKNCRDPQGGDVLRFAVGAKIVGITFPTSLGGTWCIGYHDGQRGSFPASYIALEKPDSRDYLMVDRSSLVAYVRWDFKATTNNGGTDWLQLRKGEKITCIGYTFQDNWCWSGQSSKGKFGLFPQAFVEDCHEEDPSTAGPSTVPRSSGGLMSKFGLGRNKSARHDRPQTGRSASIMSASSSGSGNGGIVVKGQPGLEVVASPIHGSISWRT